LTILQSFAVYELPQKGLIRFFTSSAYQAAIDSCHVWAIAKGKRVRRASAFAYH
jgi:hypothetical protein